MIRKASLLSALSALALVASMTSCKDNLHGGETAPNNEQVAQVEPTAEAAALRCAERWDKIIAAGDDPALWIEVYDYETPARKQSLTLPEFQENKSGYVYDQPTKPKVLLLEEGRAWIDMSVQWLAGLHPAVRIADNKEGTMIEPMDMIEEWQWVNDDWHFVGPKLKGEFFRENPDFLERAREAASRKQ